VAGVNAGESILQMASSTIKQLLSIFSHVRLVNRFQSLTMTKEEGTIGNESFTYGWLKRLKVVGYSTCRTENIGAYCSGKKQRFLIVIFWHSVPISVMY